MKKAVTVLLSLLLIFASTISVYSAKVDIADTGETLVTIDDWIYTAIDGGKNWKIYSYEGSESQVVVPRIVNEMMVTTIGSHSFANNTTVTSVETSSPLRKVDEYAFLNCRSLESFICNFALTDIGVGAFSGTSSLNSINLEASAVTVIRPHVFMSSGIEEVTLPDTCTEIMHDAFSQCADLTKIVIPRSVTTIDDTAFTSSENLTIYCYTDSAAHQYAVAKDIPFVLIDAPVEVTFIMGDSDGDGFITVMDATKVQRVLADLDEDPDGMIALRAANGEVLNIMHATAIQRYLADFEVSEPIGQEVTRTVTV